MSGETQFKGTNTLVLNGATLNQALEHWLNTRVFDSLAMVRVTNVEVLNNGAKVSFEPLPAPDYGKSPVQEGMNAVASLREAGVLAEPVNFAIHKVD